MSRPARTDAATPSALASSASPATQAALAPSTALRRGTAASVTWIILVLYSAETTSTAEHGHDGLTSLHAGRG